MKVKSYSVWFSQHWKLKIENPGLSFSLKISAGIGDRSPARYLGDLSLCAEAANDRSVPPLEEVTFTDGKEAETVVMDSPKPGWTEILKIFGRGADAGEAITAGLAALEAALAAQGRQLAELVRVVLYIVDMGSFAAINAAYSRHFGQNPPVRVCVAVGRDRLPPGIIPQKYLMV
jgi:enamine deaminase RidA (YjgF/YER057c/UK114 family)